MPEIDLAKIFKQNIDSGIVTPTPIDNHVHNAFEPIRIDADLYKEGLKSGVDMSNIQSEVQLKNLILQKEKEKQEEYLIFGIGMLCVFLTILGIFLWLRRK